MKKLLAVSTVCISLTCYGQDEVSLIKNGKSLEEITPNGWKVLDSKTGDLNQDGIADLVFAIQNTDKKYIETNAGIGSETVDLNPRRLGIYFGTASGAFVQKFVSKDFIILRDSPAMDEPFDGFHLSKRGVLDINFSFWYSAGSWNMSNHKYRFRFQNNEFELIGYDSHEAHRASGETTDYSINFLTSKMRIEKGNFSKDESDSVQWKRFHLKKRMTIRTMVKPFNFAFEGIYI